MSSGEAGRKKVCMASDLNDGEMRQVTVEGLGTLAIYRVGDQYFATDDQCTHAQGSLSDEGYLEEFVINCSWHNGAFDIRTGEPKALPCIHPLKTYPVTIRDGAVYVQA